jgi:hypothetical protein
VLFAAADRSAAVAALRATTRIEHLAQHVIR